MGPCLSATIRIEDVLILGAVLLAGPLIFDSGDDHFSAATDVGALVGLLYLIAVIGAIVVLGTRDPDDQPCLNLREGDLTPRAYAPFPLIAVLGMIGSAGAEGVGLGSSDVLFGPVFLAAIAAFLLYEKLPVISTGLRRSLMTPCILISAVIFNGIITDLFSEVRPTDIAGIVDSAGLGAAVMLFIFLPGVFYVMFVYAPRQLAETEGTWAQWLVRYGLYLGAAIPGAALLSVV